MNCLHNRIKTNNQIQLDLPHTDIEATTEHFSGRSKPKSLHFFTALALALSTTVPIAVKERFDSAKKIVSFESSDLKKIGLGLTGFGALCNVIGVIRFFDKGFLAMGNILILSGVTLTIGVKHTLLFFIKPQNYKGSVSFSVGFFLVIIGWPIFGMLVETYSFVALFSGFWPTIAISLRRIPIVGWIFSLPIVISFFERGRPRRVPI